MSVQLSKWLNERFLAWEQARGKRQTVSAFARYLNVPQSSLSSWMAGSYAPSGENLFLLASKLGTEIYAILGIEIPPVLDPDLSYIISVWNQLSTSEQQEVLNDIRSKIADVKK